MKVNRMVVVAIAVGMAISSTAQAECTTIDFENMATNAPVFGLNAISPLLSIYGDVPMEVLQEGSPGSSNPSILAYNSNVYGSNGDGGQNWLPGPNAKSFGNASTERGATSQDLLIGFSPDIAVASFAIDISDFGDWFPNGESNVNPHVVSLLAYDSADNFLIGDTLSLDYSLANNDVFVAGLRNLEVTVNNAAIAYVTLEFEDVDPGVSFDNIEICKLTVNINVHPSSDPNPLNLNSGGSTPVAIFGSEEFDVTQIDIDTLTFADSGVKTVGKADRSLCSISDIGSYDEGFFDNLGDPDGFDDIVCHFITAEIVNLPDGTDLSIELHGQLNDGRTFEGTDLVKVKNSDY